MKTVACIYYDLFWCLHISYIICVQYVQVMRLLQRGNRERTQEPTAANKTSSRSHALLMVGKRVDTIIINQFQISNA